MVSRQWLRTLVLDWILAMSKLHLSTFQIGAPAKPGQGLRIGATRHPPRGVPKERWVVDGYFDVWLPTIAPDSKLVTQIRALGPEKAAQREKLLDRYERELLSDAAGRQTVELLAQIALRTPISIGCFCVDESLCHRSRLFKIIQEHAESGGK
jgi:uncharacterized protein YeaO (DUF488 family)